MNTYIYLACTNVLISSFTFGGGYVVIPMMRKYYVEKKAYLSEEELLEAAAIAQSVPGAIAVNLAVACAYRIKGKSGAFVAMIASVLPAFIILSIISTCYEAFRANIYISAALKGMEAAVAAIMVDVVLGMIQSIYKDKIWHTTLLIPLSFIAVYLFQIHVAIVLIGSVIISLLWREGRVRKWNS